jgi:ribosomal protein L25 (general stress protein Ctc)
MSKDMEEFSAITNKAHRFLKKTGQHGIVVFGNGSETLTEFQAKEVIKLLATLNKYD